MTTIAVLVALGVVGIVGLVAAPSAAACSCAALGDAEAFDSAPAVFRATVMERRDEHGSRLRSTADPVRYVFTVDRVYKGDVYATQSVVTAAGGPSCGFELSGPGPFLVFTRDRAVTGQAFSHGVLDGEFVSNLCSGTRRVTAADPVPASFGAGHPPLAGSSPIGHGDGATAWWRRLWAPVAGGVLVVAVAGSVVLGRRRRRAD